MTPEKALVAIALKIVHAEQKHTHVVLHKKDARTLLADSSALRELVAALPKCVCCDKPATVFATEAPGGCYCDEHAPERVTALSTAAVMRKLGL